MNPLFFNRITQAASAAVIDGFSVMDYVETIGWFAAICLGIYKLGDLKMILYILAIGAGVSALILFLPQLQGSPIQLQFLDLLSRIPEYLGLVSGGAS